MRASGRALAQGRQWVGDRQQMPLVQARTARQKTLVRGEQAQQRAVSMCVCVYSNAPQAN